MLGRGNESVFHRKDAKNAKKSKKEKQDRISAGSLIFSCFAFFASLR
jgi:hypothetical protein